MAAKKKTDETTKRGAKSKAVKGSGVTNNSTVDLVVNGVKIKANGGRETVEDFDPKNAKYAAFIEAKMISVE